MLVLERNSTNIMERVSIVKVIGRIGNTTIDYQKTEIGILETRVERAKIDYYNSLCRAKFEESEMWDDEKYPG